jgi:type II secretory pathway component GspD/PulD (secretin)
MKRLEARAGVDILATPRITTLSSRQAQIKIVDIKYVVTDLDHSGGETNGPQPISEPFELGPVLDVIPVLQPDGVSIELKLISTIREFIGYDLEQKYFDSGPPKPLTPVPLREYARENNATPGGPMKSYPRPNITPLPIFRLRQAQTTARVWDGQTVVLKLSVRAAPLPKPNIKFTPSGKTCFLFVTPTLIDPAGNRLHEESTLPFVEQTVPE